MIRTEAGTPVLTCISMDLSELHEYRLSANHNRNHVFRGRHFETGNVRQGQNASELTTQIACKTTLSATEILSGLVTSNKDANEVT